MSDWEEIRRLAADFQRAQLAGSAQKLSERNCIEIVTKLIGKDRVDRVRLSLQSSQLGPPPLTRRGVLPPFDSRGDTLAYGRGSGRTQFGRGYRHCGRYSR
jgi:hypothetical protein